MADVYSKIRKIRKERNLTLKQISKKTGLSLSFLSQVERNKSDITLMSLMKIAKALNVEAKELFNNDESQNKLYHRKKEEFKLIETGHNFLKYEKISGVFENKKIDSIFVTCKPYSKTEYEAHEGEEFFYILEGEANFDVDGKTYVVKEGETIHYPSNIKHTLRNNQNVEMKAIAVITELL